MDGKDASRTAAVYLFALSLGAQSLTADSVFYKVQGETIAQSLFSVFNKAYANADGQLSFHCQPADAFVIEEQILLDEAVDYLASYDHADHGLYDPAPPKDALRRARFALRARKWEAMLKQRSDDQAQGFVKQETAAATPRDAGGETAAHSVTAGAIRCLDSKIELTDTEHNTIKALGRAILTGEKLAKKAGYPFNSNFKNTLSSLRKRGILGNASPGYFVTEAFCYLLDTGHDKSHDNGQGKGQD